MKTVLYIVRHTQTVGNIEKRLTGRHDYEITEEGKKYIKKMEEALQNIKFESAYSSTSGRTIKTIQNLANKNGIKIKQLEELCEMDFGIYDGMKWEDLNKINPKIHKMHIKTNEIMGIPNQETTQEVIKRMNKIMLKIANENLGKPVLVCSHGVAIEAFLRSITRVPFVKERNKYSQINTSLNIVSFDSDIQKFSLEKLNDLSHLKKEKKYETRFNFSNSSCI